MGVYSHAIIFTAIGLPYIGHSKNPVPTTLSSGAGWYSVMTGSDGDTEGAGVVHTLHCATVEKAVSKESMHKSRASQSALHCLRIRHYSIAAAWRFRKTLAAYAKYSRCQSRQVFSTT